MRERRHVVVFLRAPQLGRVKRRLARDIGAVAALAFYRATATRLIRVLARDRRWRCHLAVTPDRRASWPRPWRRGRVAAQGQGDLGRRMARVFRRLPPGPAVIVGADIPGLGARHVAAAFAALGGHDVGVRAGRRWRLLADRPGAAAAGAAGDLRRCTLVESGCARGHAREPAAPDAHGRARRPGRHRRWRRLSPPSHAPAARCSCRRGISSTRLHGRWRLSSWWRMMSSQPSRQAPGEPGRAKR